MKRPTSRAAHRLCHPAVALFVAAMLSGCGFGGPKNFENENDRLRAENLELRRQVQRLDEALALRLGEVRSLRAKLDGQRAAPPGVETPILSAIRLDRHSGPIDEDGDGRPDAVVAYVRTLDQRGRFLPVAAEVALALAEIDADADAVAVIARRRVTFEQFDDAFRSGLTGTHHTLRLPLPPDSAADLPEQATLRVELSPADSDAEFTAQRVVRLVGAPR